MARRRKSKQSNDLVKYSVIGVAVLATLMLIINFAPTGQFYNLQTYNAYGYNAFTEPPEDFALVTFIPGMNMFTNPSPSDHDGDGVSDQKECPDLFLDSDFDGIEDIVEILQTGTAPDNEDTDGDGYLDGVDSHPLDPELPIPPTLGPSELGPEDDSELNPPDGDPGEVDPSPDPGDGLNPGNSGTPEWGGVSRLTGSAIVSTLTSNSGLVAELSFDSETAGKTPVTNSNSITTATVSGATITTNNGGFLGEAYVFDGVDDFIQIAADASLRPLNQLTFSSWVYLNANTLSQHILQKDGSVYGVYGLNSPPGAETFRSFITVSRSKWTESTKRNLQNQWAFLTITYDGISQKIYVNGVLDNKIDVSGDIKYVAADQDRGVFIGKGANTEYPFHFNGLIDEVRLYNSALTETEVSELYDAYTDFDGDGILNDFDLCPDTAIGIPVDSMGCERPEALYEDIIYTLASVQDTGKPGIFFRADGVINDNTVVVIGADAPLAHITFAATIFGGSDGGSTEAIIKLDTEMEHILQETTPPGKNLILIGGPLNNKLSAKLLNRVYGSRVPEISQNYFYRAFNGQFGAIIFNYANSISIPLSITPLGALVSDPAAEGIQVLDWITDKKLTGRFRNCPDNPNDITKGNGIPDIIDRGSDYDGDGWTDWYETNVQNSNPLEPSDEPEESKPGDSDGDGFNDEEEAVANSDRSDPNSIPAGQGKGETSLIVSYDSTTQVCELLIRAGESRNALAILKITDAGTVTGFVYQTRVLENLKAQTLTMSKPSNGNLCEGFLWEDWSGTPLADKVEIAI